MEFVSWENYINECNDKGNDWGKQINQGINNNWA
jgi:hypothetical protein